MYNPQYHNISYLIPFIFFSPFIMQPKALKLLGMEVSRTCFQWLYDIVVKCVEPSSFCI